MQRYDVLVVGAGPAGLSAAFCAAQAGVRVAVLERSREIGYPIHTSGGSWIDELRQLDIPERFMHPITQGQFYSPTEEVTFDYDEAPSCVLDIRGLYQYLAELASSVGAEIFVNTKAVAPIFLSGQLSGVSARTLGRPVAFEAPVVIDASGFSATLAQKVGLTRGFQRFGVGAEYDLYAPSWPENRVAFLFGSRFAPAGYAWVFPRGGKRVRLGVGVIRPRTQTDPKVLLEAILRSRDLFDEKLCDTSRLEFHSGTIPGELFLRRTFTDGLLVVGDAGGLISTLLGEGIRFAIDIGRMAGQTAAKAVHLKRFDAAVLGDFETTWRHKYGHVFKFGAHVNRKLSEYSDRQWDGVVRLLKCLPSQWLPELLKGHFRKRDLLKKAATNPGLLKEVLKRSLFKST